MINAIIAAVSIALRDKFGSKYKIYAEEKKQDLEEPCFFVFCINPTSKLFLNKRYFRTNQFCIHYFPENERRKNEECHEVAEQLFSCLEWLEVDGDLVMGTKMKYEVADGILHFFVNYDLFVYRKDNSASVPTMGEIEICGNERRRYGKGSDQLQ